MFKEFIDLILFKTKKSYKSNILVAFFVFGSLFSCNPKTKKTQESKGAINSISIIIDDQLWNGEIGDTIRNKFAAPVIGLPQEEPIFTINQYPVKLLEGFMNTSRNIILVKKEPKSIFDIKENEFAKPQNVVHISGNSVQEILDTIEKNSDKIIAKIKLSEIKTIQKTNKTHLLKLKKIKSKFRLNIEIPNTYKTIMRRNKFVWLKKEITSGSCSILIYETPKMDIKNKKLAVKNIVKNRDSISNLYIHGTTANAVMVTETTRRPYFFKTEISQRKVIETKGNWEMKNDNMGGPFINYTFLDGQRNRMLIIEGFCYAPSKEKRDLMTELEAIIKTVSF
jgi:Domain of unknown function (DUF4837)